MRNPTSRRCEAHHHLSLKAGKRVLLSGTFCVNGPVDLAGICKAGNAPRDKLFEGKVFDLQNEITWLQNRCSKTINRTTVTLFQRFFLDRATGKPILPVEERPVPQGVVPGERLSKTQPYSVGIPSFTGPRPTEKGMWGLTPIDQAICRIRFR